MFWRGLNKFYLEDLSAGVSVFLIAVPLCLGIAHASGAPVLSGIISGIIGGIIAGFLSGSRLSVSGPAAGLTSVLIASLHSLGSMEALLSAVVVAGLFQLLLAFLKAGRLADFFPAAVVSGMLAAIGILLIIKQVPHAIGYDVVEFGVEEFSLNKEDIHETYDDPLAKQEKNTLTVLLHSFTHIKTGIALIGFASLAVFILWEKYASRIIRWMPASLAAVLTGIMISEIFDIYFPLMHPGKDNMVQLPVISSVSDIGKAQLFPAFPAFMNPEVWKVGFTLAMIASLETLLSVEAIDRIDPAYETTPKNRELFAQGVGNIFCGLLGGIPVTSVIVRSSVNLEAGAKSKNSAVIHGFLLFITSLFLAPLINRIPLASLAVILVIIGYKLSSLKLFSKMYRLGLGQFIPFTVTVGAILFTDLLTGVFVGFLASLIVITRNHYELIQITVKDMGRTKKITLLQYTTFLHKAGLKKILHEIPKGSIVEVDGSGTRYIDQDVISLLSEFREFSGKSGTELIVSGIPSIPKYSKEFENRMNLNLQKMLENNIKWAEEMLKTDPGFFKNLSQGQSPDFFFIGCSDSRITVNEMTGTSAGDIFVHRNIANIVTGSDMNLMSALEYAVDVLKVQHVIVCGHYGCGGVKAAIDEKSNPGNTISNWIQGIVKEYEANRNELDSISDKQVKENRMIEYHLMAQMKNLSKLNVIRNAVEKFGFPKLHAWIYDIHTGHVKVIAENYNEERV